ncbi:CMF_HP2_G0012160.mRNA.1.CDS.1 [Saccharomyces cerevisiae]|nr:CMF_HP2_G0012160.mRNA.1.CDS.1 [Saccharomyces cerevisiae]CAI6443227.1 CMF_HP2_G0012160.mRNA.1.CDS.1 [Saccharomyces cerevisiae]
MEKNGGLSTTVRSCTNCSIQNSRLQTSFRRCNFRVYVGLYNGTLFSTEESSHPIDDPLPFKPLMDDSDVTLEEAVTHQRIPDEELHPLSDEGM